MDKFNTAFDAALTQNDEGIISSAFIIASAAGIICLCCCCCYAVWLMTAKKTWDVDATFVVILEVPQPGIRLVDPTETPDDHCMGEATFDGGRGSQQDWRESDLPSGAEFTWHKALGVLVVRY